MVTPIIVVGNWGKYSDENPNKFSPASILEQFIPSMAIEDTKALQLFRLKKNYCIFSCKISTYLTWGMMSNIYKPQVFARDLAALSWRMKVPLTS